jgi:hypothetical protein
MVDTRVIQKYLYFSDFMAKAGWYCYKWIGGCCKSWRGRGMNHAMLGWEASLFIFTAISKTCAMCVLTDRLNSNERKTQPVLMDLESRVVWIPSLFPLSCQA